MDARYGQKLSLASIKEKSEKKKWKRKNKILLLESNDLDIRKELFIKALLKLKTEQSNVTQTK